MSFDIEDVKQKMIERVAAELQYGIIINDLDIRQLKIESIRADIDKKKLQDMDAAIKDKENAKEYLEKRLDLLNFYKPIEIDKETIDK